MINLLSFTFSNLKLGTLPSCNAYKVDSLSFQDFILANSESHWLAQHDAGAYRLYFQCLGPQEILYPLYVHPNLGLICGYYLQIFHPIFCELVHLTLLFRFQVDISPNQRHYKEIQTKERLQLLIYNPECCYSLSIFAS